MSRDTEPDWDFVFVEAHTVGAGPLDDASGRERRDVDVDRRQLRGRVARAAPVPLPLPDGQRQRDVHGDRHDRVVARRFGGNSGGWKQWSIDLSRYAGRQVQVSISYASDWSVQGLGAFVDGTVVSTGESPSFEDGLGGWQVSGPLLPPAGSGPNGNDWISTSSEGFPEGATITTPHSIYLGFGLEGISGPASRASVMGRAMGHLLP
jgi:hypothetical protein